jgi:hypothetical protein
METHRQAELVTRTGIESRVPAFRQLRERAPAMLKAIPPAINTTLMMGETRSL